MRCDLEAGESGAACTAQIVQGKFGDAQFLHAILAARDASRQ
jgi:hypothetical protein